MNMSMEKQMQGQLLDISATVEKMRASVQVAIHAGLEARLTRMWEISQELQRDLIQPAVVAGYKRDAADQMNRVTQLWAECNGDPDEMQSLSICMACEMACVKIRTYLSLDRAAVHAAIRRGHPTEEDA